jgi:ferrous iron transport protein B
MLSCHSGGSGTVAAAEGEQRLALVGAPNAGKSALFNGLADRTVDVSNYPGTTVATTAGVCAAGVLIDTPGVHGISSFSEEERVTREVVLEADAVVNVVDATQLDRDLFLTYQLLDMGIPTVVALNMVDELGATAVDADALEAALGVPVVETVAVEQAGLAELEGALEEARAPAESPVESWFGELPPVEASRAKRVLLLEEDEPTRDAVTQGALRVDGGTPATTFPNRREAIYTHRRERVDRTVDSVRTAATSDLNASNRIDALLFDPKTGAPLAVAALALIYLFIGDLVAQRVVDLIEGDLLGAYYVPWVTGVVQRFVPAEGVAEPVRFVLINQNLGLLTVTVQYLVGVLLPLVVAFYLVIGTLEDSGLLPRVAVLMDRGMARIGLNGRAVIPMIIGLGCVTMAVISTRIAGQRRDRLIATALLGLAIPCSAQLGVILGLLATVGIGWWFAYLGVILLVFGVTGVALDRTLPGERSGLLTELPRLRAPRPRNVLRKTQRRATAFLAEAVPLFGVTAIGISVLDYLGYLRAMVEGLAPVSGLLGLPTEFGQVLVLGVVRRDFAAAGMTDLALDPGSTLVGLVVITLFVPCVLSMAMIVTERDLRSGLLMWGGSWVVSLLVGSVLAAVVSVL